MSHTTCQRNHEFFILHLDNQIPIEEIVIDTEPPTYKNYKLIEFKLGGLQVFAFIHPDIIEDDANQRLSKKFKQK